MSNPMTKKAKKTLATITGGPQVEAIMPKAPKNAPRDPQMSMIGQGMKRNMAKPGTSSTSTASSSPAQPAKKPRLDFSSTAPPSKQPGPTAAAATAHLRPPLGDLHKLFCENTDVVYDSFDSDLDEACKAEKYNKAVRLICAVLRDIEKKKETAGTVCFEENVAVAITKAIRVYGSKLKNSKLQSSILYMLCTSKGMPPEKQSLLISWLTHINHVQENAEPILLSSYLHDALGDRNWVDKPYSLEIVTRVLKYLKTRFPSRAMYSASGSDVSTPDCLPSESTIPLYFGADDIEDLMKKMLGYLIKSWEYHGDSPPRSLLKTMNAFAGVPEVRLQTARKIDGWLQNAKLQRIALEMLLYLGTNIGDASKSEIDRETIGCLMKLRSYKSKMVTPVFAVMLRELLSHHKANLRMIVRLLLHNEFGNPQHRFHLNMALFHSLFGIDNKRTTMVLGCELAKVIVTAEANYKPARLFIRELVRSCLRTDFLFSIFTASFMEQLVEIVTAEKRGEEEEEGRGSRDPLTPTQLQQGSTILPPFSGRLTIDTCTWLPLVAITQQVREAFANRRAATGAAAPAALETIHKFQNELREYHKVVIQSLVKLRPILAAPHMGIEYGECFYRMLFLEQPDSYISLETGTADEVAAGLRVVMECQIEERIVSEITKCDTLSKDERFALLEMLILNAIHTRVPSEADKPLLNITSLGVFEDLFKLAEGKDGVTTETRFWKAWKLVALLLCACPPPPVFGRAVEEYPMMRMMSKMILMGNFSFPLRLDGKTAEAVKEEWERVKEDEKVLAASEEGETETKGEKRCMMSVKTVIRPPPRSVAAELAQLAANYKMAAELAQIRQPDLLAQLIAEEGTGAAMPAIEAVIQEKSSSHSFIPVICCTQFLLHHTSVGEERRAEVDEGVVMQMSARLRDEVTKALSEEGEGGEEGRDSLLLLLQTLASGAKAERDAAVGMMGYLMEPSQHSPLAASAAGQQEFSLERLTKTRLFGKIRTSVCECVASAYRVESESARVQAYVEFLTRHAADEELHKLSLQLSSPSARQDDAIRTKLVGFFARYIDAAADELRVEKEWRMVRMASRGREISLVSSTLFFILELLSRFRGGGEGRERLLKLILSEKGELPEVKDEKGGQVELLNDQLRGAMLSSTDESIVKVALGRVDSLTAFNMICTFGLTTFSASNLLLNLDALDASSLASIPDVKRALPFVIGYRKRGANGGEKFLSLISPPETASGVKQEEEAMECEEVLVLPPPPTIECAMAETIQEVTVMGKAELSKRLREMIASGQFSLTQTEFRSAAASEQSTEVCLEALELNLKFFLSHVGTLNDMLQLVVAAAENYPAAKAKLRALCARVLKSAAVPPSVEEQIRRLAEAPAPKEGEKKGGVVMKKPLDLKCATAEDLLETLHKRKNMTNIERARLINRFVLLRPEIIDIRQAAGEIDRQIARVFGVQAREGLDRLMAQLWLRASPETIEAVLRRVLREYNQNISPSAVLELLRHCSSSPAYFRDLTKAELKTACAYMLEKATEEHAEHPSYLLTLGDFVNSLVPITGLQLLQELASHCIGVDRSTATHERRVAAAALLAELQKRFPCLRVSASSMQVEIEGAHRGIESADKELTKMLVCLFDCKDDSAVAAAIDSLTQYIHTNRGVVMRQLPVLSRLIARISENPAQQIKEGRRFRWIINFLISSMAELLEDLPQGNTVDLDRMIDGLLEFYQRHVMGTRDEVDLSRRVLDLILVYLRSRRTDAREFIQCVGGERVNGMLETVRDEQFEEIRRVIESM